jgi:hypothetical protein
MLWILFTLCSLVARAHQTSFTPTGAELYWPSKTMNLGIKNSTSDLSSSTSNSIIQNSINEWNSVGSIQIQNKSSSKNEIIFTNDFEIYGSAVVGITELNYNPSGAINKATIYLNDNYKFSSSPSSFVFGSVYLGDVVTHEIGHFLGLAHSEVLDSSMFYTSFAGQYSISADDKSGILQKYGSDLGSVRGYVKGGNQVGVLGVHVQLISRKTGEVIGAITDENGYFLISGLDLDNSYYLYTSPIKNAASLPGYFSNLQTDFCPGSYTGSFFSECGREYEGVPQEILLNEDNKNVSLGTITINCGLKVSEDYAYRKIQDEFEALTLVDATETEFTQKSFVGYFSKLITTEFTDWETFQIDLSGFEVQTGDKLKIHFITYPFGNQLEYEMQLLRNDSVILSSSASYSIVTGTYNNNMNFELSLSQTEENNDYDLKLRAKKMSNSTLALTFPDPDSFSSSTYLPYLVIVSLSRNGNLAFNSGSYLTDNESCLDAPYTYRVEKASVASEDAVKSESSDGGAGCGTIDDNSNGQGPRNIAMGFFFGIVVWQIIMALGRKSKIFLS